MQHNTDIKIPYCAAKDAIHHILNGVKVMIDIHDDDFIFLDDTKANFAKEYKRVAERINMMKCAIITADIISHAVYYKAEDDAKYESSQKAQTTTEA